MSILSYKSAKYIKTHFMESVEAIYIINATLEDRLVIHTDISKFKRIGAKKVFKQAKTTTNTYNTDLLLVFDSDQV